MFLALVDVAVVDGDTVRVVPSPRLNGDIGEETQDRIIAQRGSRLTCRIAASLWPGGRDDTAVNAGRVALADPDGVTAHLAWAADHPRDADQGPLHSAQRILAWLAATPTAAVSSLIDAVVGGVGWLLHHVPF